jgi:hypothetical protein
MNPNLKNAAIAVLAGFGVGATLVYLLEPERGKRRLRTIGRAVTKVYRGTSKFTGKVSGILKEDEEAVYGKATAALMVGLGGGLAVYGLQKPDTTGKAATSVGLSLLSRSNPRIRGVVNNPIIRQIIPRIRGMVAGRSES